MISDPGAVVLVPFPFVDKPVAKLRPALVLSARPFNEREQQSVMAMITTAAAGRWASDHVIQDWGGAGLKTACVVRAKLFTLENSLVVRAIGRLGDPDWRDLCAHLNSILRFTPDSR